MASPKQIEKWTKEAERINNNPKYVKAYIEYREKAKKADQRLVRLEALQYEKHFEGVLKFGYAGAILDIERWGGDKRFNTAPPTKVTELQAKISDIDKFLKKVSSNKRDIMKFYQARANTFNKGRVDKEGNTYGGFGKEFGVEFTWEDIANYYEDKKGNREAVKLASQTEVRVLATIKRLHEDESKKKDEDVVKNIQANKEKLDKGDYRDVSEKASIEKEIQQAQEKIKRISGNDRILAHEVERLLSQGLDYNKLMGGN